MHLGWQPCLLSLFPFSSLVIMCRRGGLPTQVQVNNSKCCHSLKLYSFVVGNVMPLTSFPRLQIVPMNYCHCHFLLKWRVAIPSWKERNSNAAKHHISCSFASRSCIQVNLRSKTVIKFKQLDVQ